MDKFGNVLKADNETRVCLPEGYFYLQGTNNSSIIVLQTMADEYGGTATGMTIGDDGCIDIMGTSYIALTAGDSYLGTTIDNITLNSNTVTLTSNNGVEIYGDDNDSSYIVLNTDAEIKGAQKVDIHADENDSMIYLRANHGDLNLIGSTVKVEGGTNISLRQDDGNHLNVSSDGVYIKGQGLYSEGIGTIELTTLNGPTIWADADIGLQLSAPTDSPGVSIYGDGDDHSMIEMSNGDVFISGFNSLRLANNTNNEIKMTTNDGLGLKGKLINILANDNIYITSPNTYFGGGQIGFGTENDECTIDLYKSGNLNLFGQSHVNISSTGSSDSGGNINLNANDCINIIANTSIYIADSGDNNVIECNDTSLNVYSTNSVNIYAVGEEGYVSIKNLVDPTEDGDAANKAYVDSVASNVFLAEYDVTPTLDVFAAKHAGKACFCVYNNSTYSLNKYEVTEGETGTTHELIFQVVKDNTVYSISVSYLEGADESVAEDYGWAFKEDIVLATNAQIGEIQAALENIIAIQNSLIGGNA